MIARISKSISGFRQKRIWENHKRVYSRFVDVYLTAQRQFPVKVNKNDQVGIVIIPWMLTKVPWYSITVGMFLAWTGRKVTFILDDMPFGTDSIQSGIVVNSVSAILDKLQRSFEVVRLSSIAAAIKKNGKENSIEKLTHLNTIWFMRGENKPEGRRRYEETVRRQLSLAGARIENLVENSTFEYLVIPGGIYGTSGLWVAAGRRCRARIVSYDSGGAGTVLLAVDGIAAQLHDIPRAFRKVIEQEDVQKQFMIAMAREEHRKRTKGVDKFAYQVAGAGTYGEDFGDAVLLPLNSSWDSAALGLHAAFANTKEWILETTTWLLANTGKTVIIRQHPAERKAIARSSDDYGKLLADHFGADRRVKFIAAADPVNTYSLLERISAVIVHTTTLGVEAAALKKVVITPSHPYYADLGFVWNASTKEQYFALLRSAMDGKLHPDNARADMAWICYYLTQCCNWFPSDFSPESFETWSAFDPQVLFETPSVQSLLHAVDCNVPISIVQHDNKVLSNDAARKA
ncbi:MAG: hypothetical protein M0042_10585 [Nitrospiraceae bacterium]|nr:hypothetical protein [Nitrospiraceae bacterium]